MIKEIMERVCQYEGDSCGDGDRDTPRTEIQRRCPPGSRDNMNNLLLIMASEVPSFVHIISFHSRFTAEYPVSSLSSTSG